MHTSSWQVDKLTSANLILFREGKKSYIHLSQLRREQQWIIHFCTDCTS